LKHITILWEKLAQYVKIFSKAQRKHFLVYIMGLILIITFRSIQRINEEFCTCDQSALNHFLTDSPWDHRRLITVSQAVLRPAPAAEVVAAGESRPDQHHDLGAVHLILPHAD